MNRSVFLTTAVIAGAAAAWVGWKAGQPSGNEPPGVAVNPSSVAPVPAAKVNYSTAAGASFDARKGRTVEEVITLLDRLRLDAFSQTTVDDSISGELFALLYSLTPDEIPGVLSHLTALPPPQPDKPLAAVLGRWAYFDGAAAMKWAQQLSPSRQDIVRGDILSGWAHSDPVAAWTWYKAAFDAAPEPRYRLEQDFPLLIHAWAMKDAKAAMEACLTEGKHGTFDGWAGLASLTAIPEKRDEVMKLIAAIPDEKVRASASRSALGQWSASAPAEAAAWIDANLPNADSNVLWSVAERYGRANPRANADWLLQRTPPEKRDEIYSLCLYQWAENNIDEAAAWLEKAGPTDMSLQIIAGRYTHSDMDRAVSWAQRVSEAKRAEAVANTLAQARTHGQKPDVSKYAAAAGVSAEELTKMVDKAAAVFGSRL